MSPGDRESGCHSGDGTSLPSVMDMSVSSPRSAGRPPRKVKDKTSVSPSRVIRGMAIRSRLACRENRIMAFVRRQWAVLLLLLLAGCTPKTSTDAIQVAHLVPLTGPHKKAAEDAQRGMLLAV